jgi:serine/threonine-protein kinase RsbT
MTLVTSMATEMNVTIRSDTDVVLACQKGRSLAAQAGFLLKDQVIIVTAISEITRNILTYAGHGQVCLRLSHQAGRPGLTVIARDEGPGIVDIEQALQDGYSSGQGLGLGLPGARRLMDEFEIASIPGRGTTVTMSLWLKEGPSCLIKL